MKWSSINGRILGRALLAFVAAVCLAVVAACSNSLLDEVNPGPGAAGAVTLSGKEIGDLVATLVVAKEGPMTGYTREKFPHWDTNKPEHGFTGDLAKYTKCTSREVMMLRDANGKVTLDAKTCDLTVAAGGGWQDHYGFIDKKTGQLGPYKFITDPSKVDAEHIVALAEAWRSGAADRDEDTRRRIANDSMNLVAADPSANRSKGDQDPANYLPPGNFRCAYVEHYVKVKVKYALTVDTAEHTALRTAVDDCLRRGEFK
ncbi:HNH endonuclease family protein [Nocardia salmonicida]|uniref:HNH endonuclease family protein n=1 Tax=Nocardia TaxID=1817 RepID=UPI002657FF38|nr:HNH endonuclease family protein [Nocardia sp. PE-7]WKG10688.1 HNH endonuclease family protein [Nocardia sp. PE-7]